MDTTAFPAHLKNHIDKILTVCRAQMTEGDVSPVSYLVHSPSQTMVPIDMHMDDEMAKDIAAQHVRWSAKSMDADAIITVSEAWSLSNRDMGRYDEIVEKYGSVGEYPGKLDILLVNVQTHEGTWRGRALIETKGQARRCGELEVALVPPAEAAVGRFARMLPERGK